MTNDQSVGPSGPSTPTRWMTAPMHIPNVPDCCKVNLNTCENQPAKHVQSIKPNQVIQVQPGINIVRRDDNNDVDVVVEMDIDPECTDANASIANTAGHTETQYDTSPSNIPGSSENVVEEVELQQYDPYTDRIEKLEESITVEFWRQGMLVRRVKENERMLKHMMSIVANLQDTYVSHMSFSGTSCPVVQSPTAMSESVAAARRRQRSPQSRNESILLENNEALNQSLRYNSANEEVRNIVAGHPRSPPKQTMMYSSHYRQQAPQE